MEFSTWKRRVYESWDDAFRALAPVVRQQSVRVAAYTQVLFLQACKDGFCADTEYMRSRFSEIAYKCGMYHQLGKALVPQEYQVLQNDFTAEEISVYQKYTTDGRQLVAQLLGGRKKKRGNADGFAWDMMPDACEQHMERWNGTGFPEGRVGSAIAPIAQIVGLAKQLDLLASETKSEAPFKEAFAALVASAGANFSPALIEVLQNARAKCQSIYTKFIHYTMTLPKTVPLVKKTAKRPLGLRFRSVFGENEGEITAFEAVPWFEEMIERPDEEAFLAEKVAQFKRTELTKDVMMYLLYEAADALLRAQNCRVSPDSIIVNVFPDFYGNQSHLQELNKLFKDEPIERDRLVLTIPQAAVVSANKQTADVLRRYLKNGIALMVDDWNPAECTVERLQDFGFRHVRLSPALYFKPETQNTLRMLDSMGIAVYAGKADEQAKKWLAACKVRHISVLGETVLMSEDDLIRTLLLKERGEL